MQIREQLNVAANLRATEQTGNTGNTGGDRLDYGSAVPAYEPTLVEYVRKNSGAILTYKQFAHAVGATNTGALTAVLKNALASGKISRQYITGQGFSYWYNDNPVPQPIGRFFQPRRTYRTKQGSPRRVELERKVLEFCQTPKLVSQIGNALGIPRGSRESLVTDLVSRNMLVNTTPGKKKYRKFKAARVEVPAPVVEPTPTPDPVKNENLLIDNIQDLYQEYLKSVGTIEGFMEWLKNKK